jgi:hypothetical protein
MKVLTIAFAVLALICGLRAAHLWHQSPRVEIEPEGFEPVEEIRRRMWWQNAMMTAGKR